MTNHYKVSHNNVSNASLRVNTLTAIKRFQIISYNFAN